MRVHCRWSLIYDSQTFPIALYLYEPRGSGKGSCSVALRLQTKFCTLFSVGEDFVANYTTDWFQIGKGVCQGCILSPCLFNLYAGYIMRNAGLEEAQAGIKIAGRNINNLIYADDTTLMAESEEKLKSLLMKVKEESGKCWLKAQHSEN